MDKNQQEIKKKLLIAIDGSIHSDHALKYAANLFSNQDDVFFQIITCVHTCDNINNKNSLSAQSSTTKQKKIAAESTIENAVNKLIANGVKPDKIDSSIHGSGQNIALTIQLIAEKLLVDCIIVGRRGLDFIGKLLMGSTSSSIFKTCHSIPLWIVDGEVSLNDIMLPVDDSINTLLAADHLGYIFARRKDIQFYLFHCSLLFKKNTPLNKNTCYKQFGKNWCDRFLSQSHSLFSAPKQILFEADIPLENINILPTATDIEESHSIISQAKKHNCGSIVIGRRQGISKGLFGGVSDRALKKTEDLALWIIG